MSNRLIVGLADQCKPEINSIGRNYVEAVRRGGHMAVILPYTIDKAVCRSMLEVIDVLLLCGGGDIAGYRFGEEQSPLAGEPNEERDSFELLLIELSLEMRKPVVGVCRGLQLINVALGGTIWQDITDRQVVNHQRPDLLWGSVHEVEIDTDSRLFSVLGQKHLSVNSTHHQAVKRLGETLHIVARSTDGIVEAIESDTYPIAAVQWHPERQLSQNLLWEQIKNWAWR